MFKDAALVAPAMTEPYAGYNAQEVRTNLKKIAYDPSKIMPFVTFPFDLRYIYYETETKLLNRSRPEFFQNLGSNEWQCQSRERFPKLARVRDYTRKPSRPRTRLGRFPAGRSR